MVTAAWLHHDLLRVQCSSSLLPNKDPPFSRQRSVIMRSRMPDKKAYDQRWHHQAHGHKALRWDNEIFHFRHLQFKKKKSVPGCLHGTHQTPETEGEASFIGSDYWGQIFLHPWSHSRSRSYMRVTLRCETELLRLKEMPLNTTVNTQAMAQ